MTDAMFIEAAIERGVRPCALRSSVNERYCIMLIIASLLRLMSAWWSGVLPSASVYVMGM